MQVISLQCRSDPLGVSFRHFSCFILIYFLFPFLSTVYLVSQTEMQNCDSQLFSTYVLSTQRRWVLSFLPRGKNRIYFLEACIPAFFFLCTVIRISERLRLESTCWLIGDMAANSIKLLTGNSHPELAKLVADRYGSLYLRGCFLYHVENSLSFLSLYIYFILFIPFWAWTSHSLYITISYPCWFLILLVSLTWPWI